MSTPPVPGPFGDDPKATAKAAKAYAKAQRPWYKKKRFMLPLALVALVVIGSVTSGGGSDKSAEKKATPSGDGIDTVSNNEENPPPADIADGWSCESDSVGWATAKGQLTNHSSGTSSYMIEITFTAGGVQYGTGTAYVNNVGAGVTSEWEANSLTDARAGTTCKLTSVERLAS